MSIPFKAGFRVGTTFYSECYNQSNYLIENLISFTTIKTQRAKTVV